MPADSRSGSVALVAHCLLNQNAKAPGLAGYPGVFEPVASLLHRHGIGIVQMRCPEVAHLGLGRPLGTDTCEQYDSPAYRRVCREIAEGVAAEAAEYVGAGYSVLCILGVEGSPSCSVSRAPRLVDGKQRALVPGRGLFMEAVAAALENAQLEVPMVGIPETADAGSLDEALSLLARMFPKSEE